MFYPKYIKIDTNVKVENEISFVSYFFVNAGFFGGLCRVVKLCLLPHVSAEHLLRDSAWADLGGLLP